MAKAAATVESIEPKKASSVENVKSEHKLANLEIEVHRGANGEVTGHTVHHRFMPKPTKNGAYTEYPDKASYPFGADGMSSTHGHMLHHIAKHLNLSVPSGKRGLIEAENKGGEGDDEEYESNEG